MIQIKRIQEAIKLNKMYVRNHKSPHERNLARMRLKILYNKLGELYNEKQNYIRR